MKLIDKDALVAEIERRIKGLEDCHADTVAGYAGEISGLKRLLSFLNTLEVIDPYEQCIQYQTVKDGIEAHAEIYSFNIESELFNQLTKEQQKLWRKEIEQACISGGGVGVELARDPRYKENLEVKEVDLKKEVDSQMDLLCNLLCYMEELSNGDFEGVYPFPVNVNEDLQRFAKHFFELGLKAKGK